MNLKDLDDAIMRQETTCAEKKVRCELAESDYIDELSINLALREALRYNKMLDRKRIYNRKYRAGRKAER